MLNMDTNKIAVDVVLIPPDEVAQLAIDINRSFPDTAKENYALDTKTCIPHITLMMGLIRRDQVPDIGAKLAVVAEGLAALDLQITGYAASTEPDGKVISGLEIAKTPELQKLHEAILDEMSSTFVYDGVEKNMFYSPPPVNEVPLYWVKGFPKTSVREHYKPHITLGLGEPKQEITPVQFNASKLALCHLGNYCTCRDILWSTELVLS